jgi:GAF domain-containing protein
MPMRATTVRFGEDLWQMLEREAAANGVSAAQFVREATILRLAMLAGMRGDDEARTDLAAVASEAMRAADDPVVKALSDPGRLAALARTGLLDSPADDRFDSLARVASRVLNAPVALVSLVEKDRQFFKSCIGLPEPWASQRETPLSHSFCQHAVASRKPLIIDDARDHPVLRDNLAIRDMNIVAYAGIPLMTESGEALGTLCVIDDKPRRWTTEETSLLAQIAEAVVAQIEAVNGG